MQIQYEEINLPISNVIKRISHRELANFKKTVTNSKSFYRISQKTSFLMNYVSIKLLSKQKCLKC